MAFLEKCKLAYEAGHPIITDDEYDALGGDGGGCVNKNNKIKLPFWMGSLNKVRTQKEIDLWKSNQQDNASFVLTSKIDGISGLYIDGNKLYSRGNGKIGSNLTKTLEHLHLPKITYPVRGELVMKNKVFNQKYALKFKNPRNLVAGLFGRKTPDYTFLKDISYIAYEIINSAMSPSEQLLQLKKDGFDIPIWTITTDLQVENLSNLLVDFKNDINIDGIVIQTNIPYKRNIEGNPSYAVAFKQELISSLKSSIVIDVEWNISKWGILKPVVIIKPIELNGVSISRLTGNNAKYIVDNGIAHGCTVLITRAGDVIPQIKKVVDPKPVILPHNSGWKGVDIIPVTNIVDNTVPIKTLVNIFDKMGVKLLGISSVSRMFKGGLDTLPKILLSTNNQLKDIGFGPVQSKNITTNIHRVFFQEKINILEICGVSGVLGYGIGYKRIELCFKNIPDFHLSQENLMEKLLQIKGISSSIAEKIMMYHPMMIGFIKLLEKIGVNLHYPIFSSSIQSYVFSGFRDNDLCKKFNVVNTLTKDTILVVKDITQSTTKTKKAKLMGVKIITLEKLKSI